MNVEGDRVGEDGEKMTEDLELWMRDPIECVKELLGNPAFRKWMSFVPERVYADENGTNRIYDEMWTADWWWEIQVGVTNFLSISLTKFPYRTSYRKALQLHH